MIEKLVLASASSVRRRLLSDAGIAHVVDPADLDEDAIKKEGLAKGLTPADVAGRLAAEKALAVSARHPGMTVLGADQVLVLGGRIYDKPRDLAAARLHLLDFRGRRHDLLSAVALARDGRVIWSHLETAEMHVRAFDDAFLDDYLAQEGDSVLSSVGCYRLESRGLQLFERIDGDYFTVLGLPMLPLLAALRNAGILPL